MYGYVYLTTNLVNGRKYIGQHKSSVFTEEYKGSGLLVRQAFDKYGRDNFKVELLQECNSKEELNCAEIKWIADLNAVYSDEYYNIAFGGYSRHGHITDEQKKRLSEFAKTRVGEKNPFYGKKHTPETIQKIKASNATRTDFSSCGANRGKVVINNGEVNRYIYPDEEVPEGFNYGCKPFSDIHCKAISESHKGKTMSEESRKKISEALKGDKNYWYGKSMPRHIVEASIKSRQTNLDYRKKLSESLTVRNQGRVWINNGNSNKFVEESEIGYYLNQGYVIGRLTKFQEGTVWITNGIENTRIHSGEEIPKGWHKGCVQRRSK